MFTMDTIRPVSEFSRKPAKYIERLKKTGEPEILTVNGKAEVVVQDARAYEETLGLLHSLKQIAISAKQHDAGQGVLAKDTFKKLEEKYGLTREKISS